MPTCDPSHPAEPARVRRINVTEADRAVRDGAVLLDVRTGPEYRAGHAPPATWIPLLALRSRIEEPPRDRAVCVICHSGGRSAVAARQLAAAGLRDVADVAGGMSAWGAAGLPVEKAPREVADLRAQLAKATRGKAATLQQMGVPANCGVCDGTGPKAGRPIGSAGGGGACPLGGPGAGVGGAGRDRGVGLRDGSGPNQNCPLRQQ